MPKQDHDAGALWRMIKKYIDLPPVTTIKDPEAQIQEIDSRLENLADDLAAVDAAVTPTIAASALGINKDTWQRYFQGQAAERDEKGNVVNISLDKSSKTEAEKQYIMRRCEILKKHIQAGESVATLAAQAKDNRENGGSLFVLQNIYGIGQDRAKDQITVSLEDLLAAAARIKERAQV